MNEPKPFASLSSGLLARKGAARPAMRPQSFRFATESNGLAMASPSLDDLGWNDMGEDVGNEAATIPVSLNNAPVARLVVPPRVVVQQEELAKRLDWHNEDRSIHQGGNETPPTSAYASDAPSPTTTARDESPSPRSSAGSKAKAAFTLRLDPDRHLRLRLICAVKHKSAQQIVTQALDEFLAKHPDTSRLASHG